MPQQAVITGTRYVLAVQNLQRSVQFYQEKLGFETLWSADGWQFMYRGAFMIMLGECPDEKPASEISFHSYFAYIDVENIDDLYEELRSKDVEILSTIVNEKWGQREFSIKTIDGHRIRFGTKIQ